VSPDREPDIQGMAPFVRLTRMFGHMSILAFLSIFSRLGTKQVGRAQSISEGDYKESHLGMK
jgi:hypothetical protein